MKSRILGIQFKEFLIPLKNGIQNPTTSSPGRFSLALEVGHTTSKAREKRPGDEVENPSPIDQESVFIRISAQPLISAHLE